MVPDDAAGAGAAGADAGDQQPAGATDRSDVAVLISTLCLIAANIAPLVAVTFLGWDLFEVLFLFWLENAVVGFYNVLKLIVVTGVGAIFTVPFFALHYSAFMAAHGSLLFAFFGHNLPGVGFFNLWALWHSPPFQVAIERAHWPLFALFASHGISFLVNFIGRGEYRRADDSTQMEEPYKRLLVMHITVIAGAAATAILGAPDFALAVLVLLKMTLDLRAHRREHRRPAKAVEPSTRTPHAPDP